MKNLLGWKEIAKGTWSYTPPKTAREVNVHAQSLYENLIEKREQKEEL